MPVMPRRQVPPRPVLGPSAFLDQAASAQPRAKDAERKAPGQAEAAYFHRLVEARIPVRLLLRDGSRLEGVLAWQDRGAIRINLPEGGHRVVPKTALATLERLAEAST